MTEPVYDRSTVMRLAEQMGLRETYEQEGYKRGFQDAQAILNATPALNIDQALSRSGLDAFMMPGDLKHFYAAVKFCGEVIEATKWKDGDIRDLVNDLRDIALEFRDAEQLRARISSKLVPALKGKA